MTSESAVRWRLRLLDAFEADRDADRVADQILFEQVGHLVVAALELVLAVESGAAIFAAGAGSFAKHPQVELDLPRHAVDREVPTSLIDLAAFRRVR